MDTAQVVARFEAERQALALTSHPAIAQVFDAGVTPQGRPFFAMEYVWGARPSPRTAIVIGCQRNSASFCSSRFAMVSSTRTRRESSIAI
jgi:hypothetical protein